MWKKFWRGLLSAALILSLLGPLPLGCTAKALTQTDIDRLENDLAGLTGQIGRLEDRLSQVRNDKALALEQKALLDEQIALMGSQLDQLNQLVAHLDALVAEQQEEVDRLLAREAAQYELFCRRVRSMEEQGMGSYFSVLFSGVGFAQMLDGAILISEIMDYDSDVITLLQTTRQEAEEARAQLERQQAEQTAALAEQEFARSRLEERRTEAAALVAQILDQESEYRTALAQIKVEEERVQAEIVRLSRELEVQNNRPGPGGYIWPVSSRKITSPFGSRNTGIPGASTNHRGVDIGNVGWTAQVCAAKAGTVIISQKNSSYGNYVVISHGDGNTTLYAHMSSRKVSVGQTVAQGDVLGITGDTGISQGPHLHFEITESGAQVDPLQYLTDYERCW